MDRAVLLMFVAALLINGEVVDCLTLTSNNTNGINTNGIVCPGEDVAYICYTPGGRIIWITPLVTISGFNPTTTTENFKVTTMSDSNGTTSDLIIKYNSNFTLANVTCSTTNGSSSLLYFPVRGIVPNINGVGRPNSSVLDVINVAWTGGMNVVAYIINCTKGECNSAYFPGDINEANITLILIKNVTSLRICVTANNTCDPPLATCSHVIVTPDCVILVPEEIQEEIQDLQRSLNMYKDYTYALAGVLVFMVLVCVILFVLLMLHVCGCSSRFKSCRSRFKCCR